MRKTRSWILLALVATLLLTGCANAPSGGPSQSEGSLCALDFGITPTVVTVKQYGYADPDGSESPAFKLDVTYPRLVSLLALAVWGTEWSNGEVLNTLPDDVSRLTKSEATIDPDAASWPGLWLYVGYDRKAWTIPPGFAGKQLEVSALLLYCRDEDQAAEMYVLQNDTWVRYSTTVAYADLERYTEILSHPPSAD